VTPDHGGGGARGRAAVGCLLCCAVGWGLVTPPTQARTDWKFSFSTIGEKQVVDACMMAAMPAVQIKRLVMVFGRLPMFGDW